MLFIFFLLSMMVSEGIFAQPVTIIHSNDVMGEIEPCGCRAKPLGGFARKANFLSKLLDKSDPDSGETGSLAKSPKDLIQVDSGDLLYASLNIPELLQPQSLLQAQFVVQGLELLSHDLVVPGEKDFTLGLSNYLKLFQGKKIQVLAANIFDSNEKLVFQPSLIIKRGGSKIGFIGVVGDDLPWPKELKISPPIDAVKKEVKKLRDDADWIIVLSHQRIENNRKLAEEIKGIDFLLGGHSQAFLQKPEKTRAAYLLETSFRNQYIGVLTLEKPFEEKNYRLIGLDETYLSPDDKKNSLDLHIDEFKKKIADLVIQGQNTLNKQESLKINSGQKFQTFPQCADCHIRQFDFWRKTPHVHSLLVLKNSKQENNLECLSCHSLGLGDPLGFSGPHQFLEFTSTESEENTKPVSTKNLVNYLEKISQAKTPRSTLQLSTPIFKKKTVLQSLALIHKSWVPVQCENCHGPGRNHPRDMSENMINKKIESAKCLACHTPERAPKWFDKSKNLLTKVFEKKKKQVSCPLGDSTE